MEEAIKGDFALVKAWKGDTQGNLVFRGTAQNFNTDCAKAGKITIAEVITWFLLLLLHLCDTRAGGRIGAAW
jgi:hypothetical protein